MSKSDAAKEKWETEFRDYVTACHEKNPIPSPDDLPKAQDIQSTIAGRSMVTWLNQHVNRILEDRYIQSKMMDFHPQPLIIITSNLDGLAAAADIIGPNHERVLYLSEEDYQASPSIQKDPKYKYHIRFWSLFPETPNPEFLKKAAQKYPIPGDCQYWEHFEGYLWGQHCGRGGRHLWKWDGNKPELLEEAFEMMTY